MNLRPYQSQGVNEIYAAWQAGHRNVLAVYPTGAGKTVTFSHIIHAHTGASCAIAHRQELVGQISMALARDGVFHKIIGPEAVVKGVVQVHVEELGKSFYDPRAACAVAGVDTIISWAKEGNKHREALLRWASQVTLMVQDEAHHLLRDNKWGKALDLFPNAWLLGVTATPERADGKGLGREYDGVFDHMVIGPGMRDLINERHLTDYRVICPPSNLDLTSVSTGTDGDYIRKQLALKTKESTVLGDVVKHYLRYASGKLGVTFVPDVDTAVEMSQRFNAAGVPAEVVTAKTPDKVRRHILRRFARREILQLVNVDLFGEGFDLPAIEVVSMARATQSYALFCLDPETEILTPEGWRSHDSVGDSVIGFDAATGAVRAVPVTGRIKRELYPNEVMYQMNGPHLSICVSDKHDLLVRGMGQTCLNWQKQHADVVAMRRGMFKVPVAGDGVFTGADLTDGELRFLGWYLSDGSLNRKTNAITITQSVVKTEHIALIRQAIRDCGFKFTENVLIRKNVPATHNNLVRFHISKGIPRGVDKHLTGWGRLEQWIDKAIPPCYDSLSREQFMVLLGALNMGDGTNNHSSLDYVKNTLTIACGTNYVMSDRIQALCVTRGLRCNLATVQYDVREKWVSLHIRDTKTATIAGTNVPDGKISGKKDYKRSRLHTTDYRPDFVWCVSNPLGTLITRRNGKVVIMGNCQQFGRALRLMDGKERAIIIDHVGNVGTVDNPRHGLPDRPRKWTLARRDKKAAAKADDTIPMRNCTGGVYADGTDAPGCFQPYEAFHPACPYCGCKKVPAGRTAPEFVDGDLYELDEETLRAMRGEVAVVDMHRDEVVQKYAHMGAVIAGAQANRHVERQEAQAALRGSIQWWAAWHSQTFGRADSEIYRRFWFKFGLDMLSAQSLGRADADELRGRVAADIAEMDAEYRRLAV